MKKMILLPIIIILLLFLTTQIFAEDFYPNFVNVKCRNDTAYALTDDGDLYYWGLTYDKNKKEELKSITTPELYAVDIKDFLPYSPEAYLLKTDGSVWNGQDGQILPSGSADKLCSVYLYQKGSQVYKRDINATAEPVVLESDVKEVKSDSNTAFLKNDGTLWRYDIDKRPILLMEDVRTFDAFFATRLQYTTRYAAVKNDSSVWCAEEETNWEPYILIDRAKSVFVFSPYYFVIDDKDVLWRYRTNTRNRTVVSKEKVLDNVMTMGMGYSEKYVAIKTDGTIWYWGNVIGQPIEHINQTGPGDVGEFQATPVRLSFNAEENNALSEQRLMALLKDEEQRQAYLFENYDYYAENYAQYFTADELEKYKQYSEKAKAEKEQAVSMLEQEPAVPANMNDTISNSSSYIQENSSLPIQDVGEKQYVLPIIIGIVILCLLFIFLYIKKHR